MVGAKRRVRKVSREIGVRPVRELESFPCFTESLSRKTMTGSQGSQNRPPRKQNGSQPIMLRLSQRVLRMLRQDSGALTFGSG
jgi:hypothetical protein